MSTPEVSTKLPAKSRLGSWPVPLLWLALLALSVSRVRLPGWAVRTDRCNRVRREWGRSVPRIRPGRAALINRHGGEHHPLDPGDIQSPVALLHGDIAPWRCRHRLVYQSNGLIGGTAV